MEHVVGKRKFNIGDKIIGNNKKAAYWDKKGVVIGYNQKTGDIVDLYVDELYKNLGWDYSHFPNIHGPTKDETLDSAHADAAATLMAKGYIHYGTTDHIPGQAKIAPPIPTAWNTSSLKPILGIVTFLILTALFVYYIFWPFIYWLEHLSIFY